MREMLARLHRAWLRFGIAMLFLMPLAAYLTFRPWGVDAGVLESRPGLEVRDTADAITFTPAAAKQGALLLLPGCPVDPVAYAPLARRIADEGFRAVVVRVPWRCAASAGLEAELDRRVAELARAAPQARWVLAGHSRGAAHAARIAARQPAHIAAYVLIGTSHPRDRDLSPLPIAVTKIAATRDGVAGEAQFERSRLPASTRWVRIEGGNHSQFAHYGFQLFDHRATISREAQQQAVVAALVDVLTDAR